MNESREWIEVPADSCGDAVIASMVHGGVDHLFFTSGTELAFYQEAIAKARAHGRPFPRLITITHEHAGLNAALGFAALSGRPAATAAHVDSGTQHYGGALHSARHAALPVLVTAGAPPGSYPGSMPGARDGGGHTWMQQTYDQNGIVRQFMKWDHRLEYQDNPGLIVSRALQVACAEPCGPVYLSVPREISLLPMSGARFPTRDQLGLPLPAAPDLDAVDRIAERLLAARNPMIVVAGSGRKPDTVPALVELCELVGIRVAPSSVLPYLCFPNTHPLYCAPSELAGADAVVVLESSVPWLPGPHAPGPQCFVAIVGRNAINLEIPTLEFTTDVRMLADPLLFIRALIAAVQRRLGASHRSAASDRLAGARASREAGRRRIESDMAERAHRTPIDPVFLSHQIGAALDDNCVVIDETLAPSQLRSFLRSERPASYFGNPASAGGWSPGAAFGAKLAAPERDIVAVAGDGFYMFGTPQAALWSAAHYRAPFLQIIYQNRSYSTGTSRVAAAFPDGYAARSGYDGAYFDPPTDFAKEAEANGAYGENVRDPADIIPAIHRGLAKTRSGIPAVIAVWLPRIFEKD